MKSTFSLAALTALLAATVADAWTLNLDGAPHCPGSAEWAQFYTYQADGYSGCYAISPAGFGPESYAVSGGTCKFYLDLSCSTEVEFVVPVPDKVKRVAGRRKRYDSSDCQNFPGLPAGDSIVAFECDNN